MKRLLPVVSGGAVWLLLAAGCSTGDNPVVNTTTPAAKQEATTSAPTFIMVPRNMEVSSLAKRFSATRRIDAETGGVIRVKGKYRDADRGVKVSLDASLIILPLTLNRDAFLTMTFDESVLVTDVSVDFGPDGVSFSRPARLNLFASGLDFSAVPEGADIHLFAYDSDTNSWVQAKAAGIYMDRASGSLWCIGGEVPHFSRYGFGF